MYYFTSNEIITHVIIHVKMIQLEKSIGNINLSDKNKKRTEISSVLFLFNLFITITSQ